MKNMTIYIFDFKRHLSHKSIYLRVLYDSERRAIVDCHCPIETSL